VACQAAYPLYSPLKASIDSLTDHAALELGKRPRDLKHELSGLRCRVERLLIQIQIHAAKA
jgi:hypothetical protein